MNLVKVLKKLTKGEGQSLVEMAIAAPLLILMFLGVFEVGWALRGYLVLVNVNRESARFAVKNATLDFSVKDPNQVGYNVVLSHTTSSLAKQLPMEFIAPISNSTMILSHMVIDTGLPCVKMSGGAPIVPYQFESTCNCTESNPDATQWFTRDDLILHPGLPGYAYYTKTYGKPRASRISGGDFAKESKKLALENNQFNCTIQKTGGGVNEKSINNVIVVETLYDQPQLLGVPIISNRFTDPVPFYTHTAMRVTSSRESDTSDSIGPTCELHPLILRSSFLPAVGLPFQADTSTGDLGWLSWDPAKKASSAYMAEQMNNPRLSIHDFTNAANAADRRLNGGDSIAAATVIPADANLNALVNTTIRVPVFSSGGATYTVANFAVIQIGQVCQVSNGCTQVTGTNKRIIATLLRYEATACE
jgi:hypothetical protein